ncbi:ABC transporter ATP-binding protein [Leucobacter sp. OH1287]|uniref:ABC transporter ATP-binding protein n=1 Tax=Leucobacter sp. OH1287 TaxID=2491049 RepID=UPI000F5F9468|nr:ATP-binding cassette domain-containing protein [Leucobacter sp. OH1287]RRD60691.1 ATP-binding cassette domain-containing protein [Leucobacter sp. OH1287]
MAKETTAGAQIRLEGISKHYPNSIALDDVSLDIKAGEFMTLLGPSGSGKTTTLNLIAGFASLTTGDVYIDNKLMNDVPVHKRELGIVFQHYALFPHMSVAANVAFPLQQRKVDKAEIAQRVTAALEVAGLHGFESRLPAELSGGQQQRVALARALVFEPRVLLLDEPLGALDKKLREDLQLELRRIHREVGRTFVFVTHDQEEALTLSDRIAVFNSGKIEQVGTAQELYDTPKTRFVAEFIGDSTVIKNDSSNTVTIVRPERGQLLADESSAKPGMPTVPVTVRQAIYLGSGWKFEIVLPDGTPGVIRSNTGLEWLGEAENRAFLTWAPAVAPELPA